MNSEMEWLKENLDRIRKPESKPMGMALILSAAALTAGVVLGLVSKWLDNLVYEEAVSWHRILERLDLGNFLSDLPFWLLAALCSAIRPDGLRLTFFFSLPACAYPIICIRSYSAVLILSPT